MKVPGILTQVRTVYNAKLTAKGEMRAVIIGGGISGLLSASVLAPYCNQIQIIDKDDLARPQRVAWPPTVHVR